MSAASAVAGPCPFLVAGEGFSVSLCVCDLFSKALCCFTLLHIMSSEPENDRPEATRRLPEIEEVEKAHTHTLGRGRT